MNNTNDYSIIDECLVEIQKYKEKLPYHLNIIEELHSNENSHSRILAKLFQYKSQERYVILESFFKFIDTHNQDKGFGNIKVKKPIISQEEERIDIWIRDEDYAIIIENKIYDAGDQEKQIERYIDKTIAAKHNKENIFVIYMPPFTREPSEQSWGKYKNDFVDRFAIVSFNEDILEWLKEIVLPNVTLKEVYLRSAIEQYIDYLEGYSRERELYRKEKLLQLIYEKIGLKQSSSEDNQYHELMKFYTELNRVRIECDNKKQEIAKAVKDSFNIITQDIWANFVCSYNEGGYFQIYKQEWKPLIVHFEWTDLTYDNYFDTNRLTFVIHAEGSREIWEKLSNNINSNLFKNNEDNHNFHYPTCYQKSYYISHEKNSFADLSSEERRSFLAGVYKDFKGFIQIIDDTLKQQKD